MRITDLPERAHRFAMVAHTGQQRKYTHDPYIIHLVEVARMVALVGESEEAQAAAYLHDVVEDGHATLDTVRAHFGGTVSAYVQQLTDPSKPTDGNRAERKRIDREHWRGASSQAQTIKLADLISNTRSIVQYDRAFAKVYLPEKRALLPLLSGGNTWLLSVAYETLMQAEAALNPSLTTPT